MRISDWSSDVCSSDLNLTVRALIAVIFSSVLMLPAGRLTVLTSVRPSRRGMAIGAAAATGRASVANSSRMARMGQPSEWNQFDAPVLGAAFVVAVRRNRRSEEHTSELQSIMRISYAVF